MATSERNGPGACRGGDRPSPQASARTRDNTRLLARSNEKTQPRVVGVYGLVAEGSRPKNREKIQSYIRDYQLHPNDIALVSSKVEWLMPLNEAFKRSEKTKVMFEDATERDVLAARIGAESPQFKEEIDKIRRRKKCFFMQNSGMIKLSTIHSFKGLEAQTVFCILTPEDEAEMVYTGITRAQKNLVVFDSSESSFRPFFQTHMTVV